MAFGQDGIHVSKNISVGNILTIIGGLFALGVFLWNQSASYDSLVHQVETVQSEINDIRCALAFNGIAATASPCTLPNGKEGKK